MFKILTNEELKEMLFNLKPENQIIAEKENGGLFKITKNPDITKYRKFYIKDEHNWYNIYTRIGINSWQYDYQPEIK